MRENDEELACEALATHEEEAALEKGVALPRCRGYKMVDMHYLCSDVLGFIGRQPKAVQHSPGPMVAWLAWVGA